MNDFLDVRFLAMKDGALFFGANVKIHIFRCYKDNQPYTHCGLIMNLAKPLLQREIISLQETLDNGASRIEAGICPKCFHDEKLHLRYEKEKVDTSLINRRNYVL